SIPRCSLYQVQSVFGSLALKKTPPIPVTRFMPSSRSHEGRTSSSGAPRSASSQQISPRRRPVAPATRFTVDEVRRPGAAASSASLTAHGRQTPRLGAAQDETGTSARARAGTRGHYRHALMTHLMVRRVVFKLAEGLYM